MKSFDKMLTLFSSLFHTLELESTSDGMFTQSVLTAISRAYSLACFTNAVPFVWDKKKFKLIPVEKGSWRWRMTVGFSIHVWLNTGFLMMGFRGFGNLKQTTKVLQIIWFTCFTFGTIFNYNNLVRPHQIALLFNNFFTATRQVENGYSAVVDGNAKKKAHLCEHMIQGLFYVAFVHSFLASLVFFEGPTTPRYYYSLFGNRNDPIWKLAAYWVFEFTTYLMVWQTSLLNVLLMIAYWFMTALWLRQIRAKKNIVKEVHGMKLLIVYRTFQFLNQEFNSVYSKFVLPWLQLMFIVIPIVANFTLIRYHANLYVPVAVAVLLLDFTCICFIIIAFPQAAAANTLSLSYLKWLKINFGETLSKRHIRSCPQLKVKFGNFFFLQRFTPFKTFGMIVYWTMKSLLLFKQ